MKEVKVNKIEEDGEIYLEIYIMDKDILYNYFTITNWDVLKIPNGIKKIDDEIFLVGEKEKEIIIKSHLENGLDKNHYLFFLDNIEEMTFSEIVIPDSVIEIEEGAFVCGKVNNFIVSDNNKKFVVENNLLCNKDKTILLACSGIHEKYVSLLPTIKRIGKGAFSSLAPFNNLIVKLPDCIKEIGAYAFMGAVSVEEIYVPKSVKIIEENAFEISFKTYPKIYVYKDSYAHKYMEDNNINYLLIEE